MTLNLLPAHNGVFLTQDVDPYQSIRPFALKQKANIKA